MNRRRGEAEQTKKQIAAKAKELFCQRGYAAASMDDICKAAEASKGSLYYHFKNKESLFLYILETQLQEWMESWSAKAAACRTATEKLYALADHYAADFQSPLTKVAEEFSGSQASGPETLEKLLELTRMHYPIFEDVLREGMETGEFRQSNVRDMSLILAGLLGGLGISYYETDMDGLFALYRQGVRTILEGIANR
ncbi:TetR/AcrR family transcriptional regulator [Paenibacillus flagellatus]|uniref:TetR family transcriptional regulator n=1 Tax=Paenibacillus flagellatus TaxID=2211139 RepID=A0A2V5JWE2_9BACL|nr:TetR/AcrR family transcriptional regulator [Paenibacillus flagellatus]PYI50492.1 TetR family transcriptional regulator [Paenibacillus flagellatus]